MHWRHSHKSQEIQFLRNFTKDPLTGFDTRRIFFLYFSARVKHALEQVFSRSKGLKSHSLEESLQRFVNLDSMKAAAIIQEAGKVQSAVAVGDFKVLSLFNQIGGHEMGDYVIRKLADIGESLARKQRWISSISYGKNFSVLEWLHYRSSSPSFVLGRIGGDEIMVFSEGLWRTRDMPIRFFRQWNEQAAKIPDYRQKRVKRPFAVAPGVDFCPVWLEDMMHFFYQHHRLFFEQKGRPSLVKLFVNVWADLSDWGSFMVKSVLRFRELICVERNARPFCKPRSQRGKSYFEDLINAYGKSIFYVNTATIHFLAQIPSRQPSQWKDNRERRLPDARFTKAVQLRKELAEFSRQFRQMGVKQPKEIKRLFLDHMIQEFIMIQGAYRERMLLDQEYQELNETIRKQALASALNYLDSG